MLEAVKPATLIAFTPKLLTMLRDGYGPAALRADAAAGFTVAIVALPLSMAIAIASGATPDRGLYAAIVGGFLVSLLGGSRYQIGGPAGAFIILVAAAIDRHGIDGMLLATAMSGLILATMGLLRLGALIRYIPHAVTVGFTAGIGVVILASQVKDLLGLVLPAKEPGPFLPKLAALRDVLPTASLPAMGVAALCIGLVLAARRWRPTWPALLIAVAGGTLLATLLDLPVATIGSAFGTIPHSLPAPALPGLSAARLIELLPTAFAFAVLGGIESLLSAVVAERMGGGRHRPDIELLAQGVANIGAALFGGICVTGTIARTATNVRARAHGPVAGMLHSVFLLLFMAVLAPLATQIPLAALAAVLVVVAWNMIERHAIAAIARHSRADAAALAATFLLVVLRDLMTGIAAGCAVAAAAHVWRRAR